MRNENGQRNGQPDDNNLDLNNTDFFVWDLDKLKDYRSRLITSISSLKSQIAKDRYRLDFEVLDSEGQCEPDLHWIKKVHFSLSKAELIYGEVCRMIGILERERHG